MKEKGIPAEDLIGYARSLKESDTIWQNGKYFGFSYLPDKEIIQARRKISQLFEGGSTLNPMLFHSLSKMEKELVTSIGQLLNAPKGFGGHFTSGGTESIILAVKAAKEHFKKRSLDERMQVIISDTAHPAFQKACELLAVDPVICETEEGYQMNLEVLKSSITNYTGLIVASAPNYPFGIIDPIESISNLADQHNIPLHVDACLGGMIIPFIEEITGAELRFDFRCHGVTSISVDLHKYGYCPKGSSLILYRNHDYGSGQYFVTEAWRGGVYGSVRITGTSGGQTLAGAWATVNLLGKGGYRKMTEELISAYHYTLSRIENSKDLQLISDPRLPIISFKSDNVNALLLGDQLEKQGWYVERMAQPDRLHIILAKNNISKLPELFDAISGIIDLEKSDSKAYYRNIRILKYLFKLLPHTRLELLLKKFASKNRNENKRWIYGLNGPLVSTKKKKIVLKYLLKNMNALDH